MEDNRAKQFLAFEALNGLRTALKEKEKILVDKKELSEDVQEELSRIINSLELGDKIKIVHYKNKQYKIDYGFVKEINRIQRYIMIDNIKISFENIFKIYCDWQLFLLNV